MNTFFYLIVMFALWGGKTDRINLVDFGRVVEFSGETGEIPDAEPIERGADGWAAYQAEDGQYKIGVEWDAPRDVAEVNIEFRHAIANREKIKIQYFQYHKGAQRDEEGNWTTAKVAEWWAGDRDISFTFTPFEDERPDQKKSDVTYRRTSRLRFLVGKDDPPPVRYIRAYGPNPPAEAIFEVRFPPERLTPPYDVSVANGYVVEVNEVGKRTTTQSVEIESGPISLVIRYAQADSDTPTRTQVTIRGKDAQDEIIFSPADVSAKEKLALGNDVVIRSRKADSTTTNPSTSPTGGDSPREQ